MFSRRVALPADLEVAYRDADGQARLLYFDRQYNDTLGLLHEDAHAESVHLPLQGVDERVLDVRLLSPPDLAVSKIARLADHDRSDIVALVERGLVDPTALRNRAAEAAVAYVGDVSRLKTSIDIAVALAEQATRRKRVPRKKR